jgi:hypothetical protein
VLGSIIINSKSIKFWSNQACEDKKDDQVTDLISLGWLTGFLSLIVKSYSLGRIDSICMVKGESSSKLLLLKSMKKLLS